MSRAIEKLNLDTVVKQRLEEWLGAEYDDATHQELYRLIEQGNTTELTERFYQELEFGTGGIRGIMEAGTNRMNIYIIRRVTQGLAHYIVQSGENAARRGVCIAYDCRNNAATFALEAALVLCANGIRVYLFESLRPTPELSFAVRYLKAIAGIVITASHNPKEYNGYKVYWEDGAQIVPPHDNNIINEVRAVTSLKQVKRMERSDAERDGLLTIIGEEIDRLYIDAIIENAIVPEIIPAVADSIKLVYTPLHATGNKLVRMALQQLGFSHVLVVPEQSEPDGNFPTVHSPNPEEPTALQMAIDLANRENADVVLATDPDSDRLGIAVRNGSGDFVLLNGNQTGSVLIHYKLARLQEKGTLPDNGLVVSTIVTSPLYLRIAKKYGCAVEETLTGFKWVCDRIRHYEIEKQAGRSWKQYLIGGEESYGYLSGDFVRDKDAVGAAALIAEVAAYCKSTGKTIWDYLNELYVEYGYYYDGLTTIKMPGKSGMETITKIMSSLRAIPPKTIGNAQVVRFGDLKNGVIKDLTGKEPDRQYGLPSANVIQLWLEDDSRISVRPSGTEPKIKFYFSIHRDVSSHEELEGIRIDAQQQLNQLQSELSEIVKNITN